MSFSRPIELKNASLSADKEPLVCAPLVGASEEAVLSELAAIVPKKPELLEWRGLHGKKYTQQEIADKLGVGVTQVHEVKKSFS